VRESFHRFTSCDRSDRLGPSDRFTVETPEIAKHGSEVIDTFGWLSLIVAAFVAAVIAIKWLVGYLNHHDLVTFGYYRIVVGVVVFVLLATNTI
jgi:undecaprenyl-diphosphatase